MLEAEADTAIARQREAAAFILDIRGWFIQSDSVMKTKKLLTLFAVVCAASIIIAQTPPYTAVEAAKQAGETATITDKVDGVHQSGKGNIFSHHGRQIRESSLHRFYPICRRVAVLQPAAVRGQTVAVSGKIALYRGKPEIVVTNVSQILTK